MIVQCVSNNINLFKDSNVRERLCEEMESPKGVVPISLNKSYVVYGVEFWNSPIPRYIICDDRYPRMYYPISYSADFFMIIDNRVSKYWTFGVRSGAEDKIYPVFCFKEWVEDAFFFDALISGEKDNRALFEKYKKAMDVEAAENNRKNGTLYEKDYPQ